LKQPAKPAVLRTCVLPIMAANDEADCARSRNGLYSKFQNFFLNLLKLTADSGWTSSDVVTTHTVSPTSFNLRHDSLRSPFCANKGYYFLAVRYLNGCDMGGEVSSMCLMLFGFRSNKVFTLRGLS